MGFYIVKHIYIWMQNDRCSLVFAVLMADTFSSISLGKLNICVVFSLFTTEMEHFFCEGFLATPTLG